MDIFKTKRIHSLQLLQNFSVKGDFFFISYYCDLFTLLEKKLQKKSKIKEMDKELQHTNGESNNKAKNIGILFVHSFFL